MKKKYNPFKMWGSYVLGIIGFLFSGAWWLLQGLCFNGGNCQRIEGYMVLLYTVGGFLLGWGIHSLFRRFKK